MIKMKAVKPVECTEGRFFPGDVFNVDSENRAQAFIQIGKAIKYEDPVEPVEETEEINGKNDSKPGVKRGRGRRPK